MHTLLPIPAPNLLAPCKSHTVGSSTHLSEAYAAKCVEVCAAELTHALTALLLESRRYQMLQLHSTSFAWLGLGLLIDMVVKCRSYQQLQG